MERIGRYDLMQKQKQPSLTLVSEALQPAEEKNTLLARGEASAWEISQEINPRKRSDARPLRTVMAAKGCERTDVVRICLDGSERETKPSESSPTGMPSPFSFFPSPHCLLCIVHLRFQNGPHRITYPEYHRILREFCVLFAFGAKDEEFSALLNGRAHCSERRPRET